MKVIHFNHHDKNNLNIGDQAHVLAIQEALARHASEPIEFVEKSIQLLGRQVIPNKFYYPKSKYYPTFLHNIYRTLIGEGYYKVLRECNEADLVIIGGGGVYMGYLFPLNNSFIQKIKTPISIIGVGYNHNHGAPEFTPRQRKSVEVLSHQASLQSVRDAGTVAFLKQQGIDAELMCDPAIFLSEQDTKIVKRTRGVLNIGINIARHGWNNQDTLRDALVDAYAGAMKRLHKTHKVRFYYMMHQPNEKYYVSALEKKGLSFAAVVSVDDARKLRAEYARLDLTISMMLHSTILAFGAGVPAVNVGYDDKNHAFMDMTGQLARYVSVGDVSARKLTQIIERTLQGLPRQKKQLAQYRQQFLGRFDDFIKRTLALVRG